MAKRVPKKKVTRRLKRSVRKSLAAVLMITSIAVAAIPVPEMAASKGETRKMSDSVRPEPAGFGYDVTDADDLEIEGLKDLKEFEDSNGTGYRLINIGDSWQLHWMFRYYQSQDFSNDNTVVTNYTDNYPQSSIDMGMSVYP